MFSLCKLKRNFKQPVTDGIFRIALQIIKFTFGAVTTQLASKCAWQKDESEELV